MDANAKAPRGGAVRIRTAPRPFAVDDLRDQNGVSSSRPSRLSVAWVGAGIVALAVACSSSPPSSLSPTVAPRAPAPAEPVPVARIFPLIEGSRWVYRVRSFVRNHTYRAEVRVLGRERVESIGREGVTVVERFFGTGPGLEEEPEPVLYFFREGFLERVYLTYQAGKAVPIGFGSEETKFLPERMTPGQKWESNTVAFRVGDSFGYNVSHRHEVAFETDSVSVPAGSFDGCLRIDTHSDHGPGAGGEGDELVFWYQDWYAPGVGLVQTRQWGDEARTRERTRIELMEYEIGEERAAG